MNLQYQAALEVIGIWTNANKFYELPGYERRKQWKRVFFCMIYIYIVMNA